VNGTEIPEIYSDLESKIGKYHRLLMYLVIFLPIMTIILPKISDSQRYGSFMTVLVVLSSSIMVLYAIAMVQIFRRINQLKSKNI
jgi:glucan phosphoethanolaminetransferase (alkaline phosphatase superfamily)